jgi:hypothetical protein
MSDIAATAPSIACTPSTDVPSSGAGLSLWSKGGFSFKDLLDIINPLQHLPVVGSIYRYLTGDEPSGGARIVGDALYGGPIGFGVGVVSTLLTDPQGHDLGERVLAATFGPSSAEITAVAKTDSSSPPATASSVPAAAPAGPAATPSVTSSEATEPDTTHFAAKLYRSPPAASVPATSPEQNFLAQNSRFQRQLTTTRATNGQTLNNRPIPLELSGNLMPANRLALTPPPQAATAASGAGKAKSNPGDSPAANPIAQKMLDALDKYEKLKKKQEQQDRTSSVAPPQVDLSL